METDPIPTDDPMNEALPQVGPPPGLIWLVRGGALVGLGLAGYLFVIAWMQTGPVGCGRAALDCDRVLQSHWSRFLGWPVSLPAVSVFASILVASLFAGSRVPATIRSTAWTLVCFLALAAGGAALWFIGLQIFVIGSFCPFCMAAHACSLTLAIAVSIARCLPPRPFAIAGASALACVGMMIVGQVSVETDSHYAMNEVDQDEAFELDTVAGEQRRRLVNELVVYDTTNHPIIGDPGASVILIKMFDYTCYYCRRMHEQLDRFRADHPGILAVVMLPVPFDPDCNPWIEYEEPEHRDACDLARLAIAVWKAEPQRFEEYHRWLFEPEEPRRKEEARRKAVQWIGAERLDTELMAADLDERIAAYVDLDDYLQVELIPKILLSHSVLNGEVSDDDFDRLLSDELRAAEAARDQGEKRP